MSGETVLVIDDSPTILKVVQLVLTKAGYAVLTAADGDEGVQLAAEHRPQIVLLDFVMPKMNGYQVCRALQQEEGTRDVPVVLMSAKGDQVGDRFVKVMGIVDYITKPFSPEAITAVVQHTLAKYAASSPGEGEGRILPEVSAEKAVSAAEAALHARQAALARLAEGVSRSVGRSIVAAAANHATALEEADVVAWARQGLGPAVFEVLLGELRAAAPELVGEGDAVLMGDLRVIPLAEVLLLLHQQEQLGVLTVTRGDARVDLYFRGGNIELATAAGVPEEFLLGRFLIENNLMKREDLELYLSTRGGNGKLLGHQLVKMGYLSETSLKQAMRQQSCELVYELMRWSFGRFAFRATPELAPVAAEAALAMPVDTILMEGFRRVDEWHLIEREIDNFDLVFLRNDEGLSRMGRGKLTREELAVLELVNGRNTVKEIVRQSRMGSFDVSKMLYRLLSVKLIRKRVAPLAV
ncbi:MAG: response regulator [Deltaproteobacteria bacterium]|nr:response regulator [Deltaproteobacteria bacterium]